MASRGDCAGCAGGACCATGASGPLAGPENGASPLSSFRSFPGRKSMTAMATRPATNARNASPAHRHLLRVPPPNGSERSFIRNRDRSGGLGLLVQEAQLEDLPALQELDGALELRVLGAFFPLLLVRR